MPNPTWRKASHCGEGEACVYVAQDPTGTRIAQRADGGGPLVAFGHDAWAAFIRALRGDTARRQKGTFRLFQPF
ncbi:DUF397 domain-containing protein [Streptomyces sp. NPDC101118]|uniref:DUF397 domain-containing protein n=1 Tax=Streptomyces sp. NPDC101118 TaxID=3366109 RepID=UPI00382D7A56